MATRDKVGNTVSEFLQDMSEYELTCPICFEEFKEPKSLPNCAHSVCLQCLEKMSQGSSYIFECPVCRVASPLPSSGVKAWPTNSRLVRLMDSFPGRQDKLAIKNAIESCRNACEISGKRDEERHILSDKVKNEVEEKAQRLVVFIRDQERSLVDSIDEILSEHAGNTKLREQAVSISSNAENVVERGDVYEIVGTKETLVSQLEKITKELEPGANKSFSDLLRAKLQGERQLTTNTSSASKNNNNISYFDPKFNRIITKTKDLDSFYPFDLAMLSTGDLVVLDSRFQNVTIFNEGRVIKSQFKVSFLQDLWGLTVSINDEIIILGNDSSDAGYQGYLVYLDINGNFIHKKTIEEFKNTFLTSISTDDDNNFIITSGVFPCSNNRQTHGGILVLDQDLQVKFSTFGSQEKLNLRKAVHYQGKYYCTATQLTEPGKEGCIKVFDKDGIIVQEFGHKELHDPHGLAVDIATSRILVCDRQLNAIVVYDLEGILLTRFLTKDDPLQIILTAKDKDIIVACYLGLCVQVISYKWFLEVTDKSVQALKLLT